MRPSEITEVKQLRQARRRSFGSPDGTELVRVASASGSERSGALTLSELTQSAIESASVTPTGATTARTFADRAAELPHVEDWRWTVAGALRTDTEAVQEAITAVGAGIGGDLKADGAYSIVSTIILNVPNVHLKGYGADGNHDAGSLGAGAKTVLTWDGAIGGTTLRMTSPTGASAQNLSGGGVSGIYFKAGVTVPAKHLEILSCRGARFEDIFLGECSEAGLDLNVVATLGDARDIADNEFRRIYSRIYTSSGIGIRLDGDATANACFNDFYGVHLDHKNGVAIHLKNSDNNKFYNTRLFRASGGSADGLVLDGHANIGETCRENTFYGLSSTAAIIARGTSSFTNPSINNKIYDIDKGNGTPTPTLETAATLEWTTTEGLLRGSCDWAAISPAPTVSASVGTITTASAVGRRSVKGQSVDFNMTITDTTNGTGDGALRATLPFTANSATIVIGYINNTGDAVTGAIAAGSNVMNIRNVVDAGYPGADGYVIVIGGTYERT